MTSFLLRTSSSSEHHNDEYDYAIVDLDEQAAKVIAGYLNLFKLTSKGHPHLLDMIFDERNCTFYAGMYLESAETGLIRGFTQAQQDKFEDMSWIQLPDDHELPDLDSSQDPDYVALIVNEHGFFWRAYPSFSDVTIETYLMGNDVLARLL